MGCDISQTVCVHFFKYSDALEHLDQHRQVGHRVPERAYLRLREEQQRYGDGVSVGEGVSQEALQEAEMERTTTWEEAAQNIVKNAERLGKLVSARARKDSSSGNAVMGTPRPDGE